MLVVATERFATFFDTNVATFETAIRNRPYLAIGVQLPIWIVGIEPEDFETRIKPRYEEMFQLCALNDVRCHPFESVFRSPLRVDDSSEAEMSP